MISRWDIDCYALFKSEYKCGQEYHVLDRAGTIPSCEHTSDNHQIQPSNPTTKSNMPLMNPWHFPNAQLFSVTLELPDPDEFGSRSTPGADPQDHMNIASYDVKIILNNDSTPIGNLIVRVIEKTVMDRVGKDDEFYRQCKAFANGYGGALDDLAERLVKDQEKTFSPDKEPKILDAEDILFIEEAYLDKLYQGHGVSLLAVDLLIKKLNLGEGSVAILHPGAIGAGKLGVSDVEAAEKLATHWMRMGFEQWSSTTGDNLFLGLSLKTDDRPSIEEVLPGLFGLGDGSRS